MPSGHAYAKAVRTVKTCVGTDFCRFGLGDAIGVGIELERRMEGLYTPHKVKSAVTGCPRNCAEAYVKDIGLVAVEGGWEIYVGGAAGAIGAQGRPARHGRRPTTRRCALALVFLQHYREHARVPRAHLRLPRAGRHRRGAARPCSTRPSRRRCSSATRSPRRRPTPTRGASATTRSVPKQFEELDTEPTPIDALLAEAVPMIAPSRPRRRRADARGPQPDARRRPARSPSSARPTGFRAVDGACPHEGGPLADGLVADRCVTCPLHGWRFDLRTGARGERPTRRSPCTRSRSATASCGCGSPRPPLPRAA